MVLSSLRARQCHKCEGHRIVPLHHHTPAQPGRHSYPEPRRRKKNQSGSAVPPSAPGLSSLNLGERFPRSSNGRCEFSVVGFKKSPSTLPQSGITPDLNPTIPSSSPSSFSFQGQSRRKPRAGTWRGSFNRPQRSDRWWCPAVLSAVTPTLPLPLCPPKHHPLFLVLPPPPLSFRVCPHGSPAPNQDREQGATAGELPGPPRIYLLLLH